MALSFSAQTCTKSGVPIQKGVKEEEDEEGTYKAARTTSTHTHPPCNVPAPASQTTRHE